MPSLRVDLAGWGGMFPMASVMVSCLDALLTARGEGLSGMLCQSVVKMVLQRGAMERVNDSGPEDVVFNRCQSSGFFEDNRVLRYLRAWVRSCGRGKSIDGFAHLSSLSSRK